MSASRRAAAVRGRHREGTILVFELRALLDVRLEVAGLAGQDERRLLEDVPGELAIHSAPLEFEVWVRALP